MNIDAIALLPIELVNFDKRAMREDSTLTLDEFARLLGHIRHLEGELADRNDQIRKARQDFGECRNCHTPAPARIYSCGACVGDEGSEYVDELEERIKTLEATRTGWSERIRKAEKRSEEAARLAERYRIALNVVLDYPRDPDWVSRHAKAALNGTDPDAE